MMNTIRVALELGRSLSCGERCNNGTKEKTVATHDLRLTKEVKKNRDKRQSGFEEWYVWKTAHANVQATTEDHNVAIDLIKDFLICSLPTCYLLLHRALLLLLIGSGV